LQKTIEAGIKGNLLEMALHGKPKEPFYMVGRMGGSTVVMREDKGTFRVSVEGQEAATVQEVEYNLSNQNTITEDTNGKAIETGEAGENRRQAAETYVPLLECGGKMSGGAVDMDRAAETDGDMSGVAGELGHIESLGETGIGGDAASIGAADKAGTAWSGIREKAPVASGTAGITGGNNGGGTAGGTLAEVAGDAEPERRKNIVEEVSDGPESSGESGSTAYGSYFSSTERGNTSTGGGKATGSITENVLRVGATGLGSYGGSPGEPSSGASCRGEGSGEGISSGRGAGTEEKAVCDGEVCGSTGDACSIRAASA
jgi:hypothetical protein